MTKAEFDKISAGLRDAIAGNVSRVHIDGQTWVRHDAGSPEDLLVQTRHTVADLTTEVDVLQAALRGCVEALDSPAMHSVWSYLHVHDYQYVGPVLDMKKMRRLAGVPEMPDEREPHRGLRGSHAEVVDRGQHLGRRSGRKAR